MKLYEHKEESINILVNTFFDTIRTDACIGPMHISLFMALIYIWSTRGLNSPIYIYSSEVMPAAKIYGSATYHRCIRELNQYGYIKYVPSHNYLLGSLVYFTDLKNQDS